MKCAVSWEDSKRNEAAALSQRLSLPLVELSDTCDGLLLVVGLENYYLKNTGKNDLGPLCVDFFSSRMKHRLKSGGGPLLKAVGPVKNDQRRVLDVTAGLGRDAYVLASQGFEVTLLERSSILFEMLNQEIGKQFLDDLQEADRASLSKMKLIHIDAVDFMRSTEEKFDVVCLDPMFPERSKSAKVKKDLQYLQLLHGVEDDGSALLPLARNIAIKKVVVKRPIHAPPLAGLVPNHSFKAKTLRLDVYLPP
ncbi:MAG: class I SAM-dependent methyltransferase [Gammaproteobacteria bacterium]|nr:class I SAM-dependent methyltransferase [Gammaproteobacteria bacterium]